MKKNIDAEKLKTEINDRLMSVNLEELGLFGSHRIWAYNDVKNIITSLQQEQPEVDLENYISNKLRELGADLINHKPYSFNRGLNVGKANAYNDILDRLNARKEE